MTGWNGTKLARIALCGGLLAAAASLTRIAPAGEALSQEMGSAASTHSSSTQGNRQGPFALVIVVDAARFDEFNLAKLPYLARLAAGGTSYSQAWVGQLPSVTETSHATIGTGVLPYRHLVLGDTWRVPGTSQMAPDLLNANLTRTGYIGKFIRQKNVPDIATLVHARFPGSRVVAISGHKVYAADALGAGDADFVGFGMKDTRGHYIPSAIPGHAPAVSILKSSQLDLPAYPRNGVEDTWVTTLAEKFLFKYHPRLMMINLPEVDDYGHIAGTNAAVLQPLMANVDHQIGRLLAAYGRAGMLSQTYVVVTADHAMVPGTHTVDQTNIQAIIKSAGGQPIYVGHGDYCPIFLKDLVSVPRVAAALANASIPGVEAVYAKDVTGRYALVSSAARLPAPGDNEANLELLSTFDSAESPDIVLLYGENTITMTPNFIKIGRKGDHGGASWGAQHIPLIISGPGIKQAYVSSYPARLVDIAPTVETLLGATPSRQDGVPLADAMLRPPTWATLAQQHVDARLLGDVQSLEQTASARR